MGPSGSGKTTLLDILAGRSMSTDGNVTINDASIQASVYKKLTSFVEQEDALVGSLTVRETLGFAARLALPRYIKSVYAESAMLTHEDLSWSLRKAPESRT